MARTVFLTSGSIFNGNPITFRIQPNVINGTPSFHRVIVEVICGMSGGDFETIKMSVPVDEEKEDAEISIDISSALRTFRDSYTYIPDTVTYPLVKFCLRVYDEYMLNGEVKPRVGELVVPAEVDGKPQYYCTLFGAFSDMERMASNEFKSVKAFSRKPTSAPEIVAVGERYVYTPPFAEECALLNSATLTPPTSQKTLISTEGSQTINGIPLYALPQTEAANRQEFRFINSLGVLESVSVHKVYSKKRSVTSNSYAITRQETFSKFSRSFVKKNNNREAWLFQTDPLNEDWLQWYLHEFLMSEYIWAHINNQLVPCTITLEEDEVYYNSTENNPLTVSFTAQLDINGSPMLLM